MKGGRPQAVHRGLSIMMDGLGGVPLSVLSPHRSHSGIIVLLRFYLFSTFSGNLLSVSSADMCVMWPRLPRISHRRLFVLSSHVDSIRKRNNIPYKQMKSPYCLHRMTPKNTAKDLRKLENFCRSLRRNLQISSARKWASFRFTVLYFLFCLMASNKRLHTRNGAYIYRGTNLKWKLQDAR